jgi:hypothetical protein
MQQVRDRQAGPLPLASPPDRTDVIYGFGRIDASGRVADRVIISALGWRGGDRLTLTAGSGVMVARRDPGGMVTVPARPYIVIPAAARRRCGLLAGDRVPAGKFAEQARRHHAMVHELLAEGHGMRAIARHLGW